MACESCGSDNVRRIVPGAVLDKYQCRDCERSFSRVAPAAKRIAIITCLTVLTAGTDGGLLGSIAAGLFGFGDDDLA